jgi:hypothetical protein
LCVKRFASFDSRYFFMASEPATAIGTETSPIGLFPVPIAAHHLDMDVN